MRRCLLLLLLVLALCAGCGSHAQKATVTSAELPSMVLQPADLEGFSDFGTGAQVRSDAHPGPRGDSGRFGRRGGWIARYKRGGASTKGPLVVESRSDLFESADGAKHDLDAYSAELRSQVGSKRIDAPALGDSALAFAFGSGSDRFILIAWRESNATASVLVEGLSLTTSDAAKLARKQAVRVDAAANAS